MTQAIPGWLNPTPFGDVGHGPLPGSLPQRDVPSEDQLQQMRKQLLESVLSAVVQAVRGLFVPGPFGSALTQLEEWAKGLPIIGDIVEAITGIIDGGYEALKNFFGGFVQGAGSLLDQIAAAIMGLFDFTDGPLGALKDFFSDAGEFIGNVVTKIASAITGIVGATLENLKAFFSKIGGPGTLLGDIFAALSGGLHNTVDAIKAFFSTLGGPGTFLGNLVAAITDGASNLVENLRTFFSKLGGPGTLLGNIVTAIAGAGKNTLAQLTQWVSTIPILSDIVDAITGAVNGTIQTLKDFFAGFTFGNGNLIAQIVKAITGAVGGTLATLTAFFADAGDFIKKLAQAITGAAGNGLQTIVDFFKGFVSGAGSLISQIVKAITGTVGGGLATLVDFFADAGDFIKKLAQAITGAAGNGLSTIVDFFKGFVSGAGSLISQIVKSIVGIFNGDALTALKDWFAGFVNGDGSLLQQIAKAITGTVGGTLTTIRTWANNLFTNLKDLIDGIWQKFTGGTGVGKTVAEAIASISGWLTNFWQKLVDGIAEVFDPTGGTGRPVQDAINAILGILGVGSNAQQTGSNALMGVEQIKAELAGGTYDELDYPASNWLPADKYAYTTSGLGNATFGPSGDGRLEWRNLGLYPTPKDVVYRRSDVTLPGDAATVKLVMSKAPRSSTGGDSALYACANMSASDRACRRVRVTKDGVEIQSVNAAGTVTNIGGMNPTTIKDGQTVECRFSAAQVEVAIDGVTVARQNLAALDANHRQVGFGGYLAVYVAGLPNPGGNLAGWTWLPTASVGTKELAG